MPLHESQAILSALAEPSRVALLRTLIRAPRYVEELAECMRLATSTVSFHLKKLESAGLITKVKEQYYVRYSVNDELLGKTLRELLEVADQDSKHKEEERLKKYRNKIFKSFYKNGRLVQLPVQKQKRRIIFEEIAKEFKPEHRYSEAEVNAIIQKWHEDYCTIRRELIDDQLLSREKNIYWRAAIKGPQPEILTTAVLVAESKTFWKKKMDKKTQLKKEYKLNPPLAGVFQILNKANGKIFIGKGINVKGIMNSQEAQLKWKSHRNRALQKDWNQWGAEQFEFKVLEYIEPREDPQFDLKSELLTLEEHWLAKLQPYQERGYNSLPPKLSRA